MSKHILNEDQIEAHILNEKSIDAVAHEVSYIAYPTAMRLLEQRLQAKPEELAAWVFWGPKNGGITAYTNANEIIPPPRFNYHPDMGENYLAPLMGCWFMKNDIVEFEPSDRYITGKSLIERWSTTYWLQPVAYIRAKIRESQLYDLHPIYGVSDANFFAGEDFPMLENALFSLSDVRNIERSEGLDINANESRLTDKPPCKYEFTKCLPHHPRRKDDWFNVIRETVYDFYMKNGACPNETEVWTRLRNNPPPAYGITSGKDRGEDAVFMDDKTMDKRSFKGRWRRYTGNE